MGGEIKFVQYAEGYDSSSLPIDLFIQATQLKPYADATAFLTAKGSAVEMTDIFYNTTSDTIDYYDGAQWVQVVSNNVQQTLSNKELIDDTTLIVDETDQTKKAKLECSGIATATTRTYTLPDANTTLLGNDNAAVVTNKDIDGGTATNSNRLTVPKESLVNLTALTRKKATIAYDETNDRLVVDDGAALIPVGSGGGGGLEKWTALTPYSVDDVVWNEKDLRVYRCNTANSDASFTPSKWDELSAEHITNLIDNSGAEIIVDGWSTSNVNLTVSRNTTNPLSGKADFLLEKDANDRQNEYFYYPFAVEKADFAKPMRVSFVCDVSSNFSYANEDLKAEVYDVTNSETIPVTPQILDGSKSFMGEFQTSANGTSYQLRLKINTTTTAEWDLYVDRVRVSSNPIPSMINLNDKQYDISSFISGWTVNRAVAIPYKTKDGTPRCKFNLDVTFGSAGSNFNLDITGVTYKNGADQSFSVGQDSDNTSSFARAQALSNTNRINIRAVAGSLTHFFLTGDVELESFPTWAVDFYPVSLSDGAETRVVAAKYTNLSATSILSTTNIKFLNKSYDTNGSYNSTTGIYTVDVSGKFRISSQIYFSVNAAAGNITSLFIYKNGIGGQFNFIRYQAATTSAFPLDIYGEIDCIAGDELEVRASSSASACDTVANDDLNHLSISRISGPATIAASEKVYARYESVSGILSIPQLINTRINFATKIFDSHAAVETGASWKFKCPVAGKYFINSIVTYSPNSWGNKLAEAVIIKNSNYVARFSDIKYTTASASLSLPVSCLIDLVPGDEVWVHTYHDNGGGNTLLGTVDNFVDIFKVD
jgi:hypothetical protein